MINVITSSQDLTIFYPVLTNEFISLTNVSGFFFPQQALYEIFKFIYYHLSLCSYLKDMEYISVVYYA